MIFRYVLRLRAWLLVSLYCFPAIEAECLAPQTDMSCVQQIFGNAFLCSTGIETGCAHNYTCTRLHTQDYSSFCSLNLNPPECLQTAVCPAGYKCLTGPFSPFSSFYGGCTESYNFSKAGALCGRADPNFSNDSPVPYGCCLLAAVSCPPGKYAQYPSQEMNVVLSQAECLECPAGKYSPTTTTDCLPCSYNEVSDPDSGATSCTFCPRGKVKGGGALSSCKECRSCLDPLAFAVNPCLPGTTLDTTIGCMCPDGYFASNNGSDQSAFGIVCNRCKSCYDSNALLQNPCPSGSYQDTTTGCKCPLGSNTINTTGNDLYTIKCVQASGPVTINNNYLTVIVLIFQFEAPYQLSEITDNVRSKMQQAVADVLNVNASNVVLSFVAVGGRRNLQQSGGVLVSVSLKDYQGTSFGSRCCYISITGQILCVKNM